MFRRTQPLIRKALSASIALTLGLGFAGAAKAATFQVTNTNDSGAGSLRRAINDANGNGGSDRIEISATGTVNLLTALPIISDPVVIDGPGADLFTVRRDDGAADFRIFEIDADTTLASLTISNGRASSGGGISTSRFLTMRDCVVSGNEASIVGGGIFIGSDANAGCFINHSALLNNVVGGEGIALEHRGGAGAEIVNTTVSGNSVTAGTAGTMRALSVGGMVAELLVRNCTIADNTGSGLKASAADAAVLIADTILANNTDGPTESTAGGVLLRGGNNLVRSNAGSVALFPAGTPNANGDLVGTSTDPLDPRLLPLGNYGGPSPSYALGCDSPAIDAAPGSFLAQDQRLQFRTRDGNGDGLAASDIGAFETQSYAVTSLDDSGPGTFRQAILDNNAAGGGFIHIQQCGTIDLFSALPNVESVTVQGPGAFCSEIRRDDTMGNFRLMTVPVGNQLKISGVTLSNGTADLGGAILVHGELDMDSCVVRDCSANLAGGAIEVRPTGTVVLSRSSLIDNTSQIAGALAIDNGNVTLSQCTLSGNSSAGRGGAIAMQGASPKLQLDHCTITQNHANNRGGGIHMLQSGDVCLADTIVAANTANNGNDFFLDAAATAVSSGGNLISDNDHVSVTFPAGSPNAGNDFVGTTAAPMDAGLLPLGDHGGPTPTHAPEFDSVVIDAAMSGQPATATDQRGRPRSLDGDCDTVVARDIGAVEYRDCRGGNVNAAGLALVFADDLENGSANFTTSSPTGNGDWAILTTSEACSPGSALFSSDEPVVKDDRLDTLPIQLPSTPALLKFNQTYDLEDSGVVAYDGAVIEISVDGGPFQDLGHLITVGGYTLPVDSNFNSPIANRMAWSGTGTPCDEVTVDLATFAGSEAVIRFRLACDQSIQVNGGWYVDDIRICDRVGTPIQDVLLVNGSAGTGSDRRVSVGTGQSITVELQASDAGPASARYFLYAWLGDSSTPVPFQANGITFGMLVNPGPLQGGGPQPFRCLRSAGIPAVVCNGVQEINAPASAPFQVTDANGLGNPAIKFTLQGMIEDFGSENALPFSITNAVILELF